jgi:hypothetical protein
MPTLADKSEQHKLTMTGNTRDLLQLVVRCVEQLQGRLGRKRA